VDTWLLLSLFPARTLAKVRPVAAADYFLANPAISWFSRHVIGIVPVERRRLERGVDVLAPAKAALAAGDILVIFPEGTRGADLDHMAALKPGVAMLASEAAATPVIPVWIQGAGRVLPKGSWLAAPLTCCVVVGEALYWTGERTSFMTALRAALEALAAEAPPLRWSDKATGEQI
jgi:1-acyl-sn-glycerol-3-phosphate acyltransferase